MAIFELKAHGLVSAADTMGILKIAKEVGVGTSVVQRVLKAAYHLVNSILVSIQMGVSILVDAFGVSWPRTTYNRHSHSRDPHVLADVLTP